MKVTLRLKADPADAVHVSFTSAAAQTGRGKGDSEVNVSILVLEFRTPFFFFYHDVTGSSGIIK